MLQGKSLPPSVLLWPNAKKHHSHGACLCTTTAVVCPRLQPGNTACYSQFVPKFLIRSSHAHIITAHNVVMYVACFGTLLSCDLWLQVQCLTYMLIYPSFISLGACIAMTTCCLYVSLHVIWLCACNSCSDYASISK